MLVSRNNTARTFVEAVLKMLLEIGDAQGGEGRGAWDAPFEIKSEFKLLLDFEKVPASC